MQKSGGAVILMQKKLISQEQLSELASVRFLVGDIVSFSKIESVSALLPFDEMILEFLNDVSKKIMSSVEAKAFPDVVTFGFWIRKSSMIKLKERFLKQNNNIYVGRGIAFHIAPSNVPVNYAYSLVAGLLTGNINLVRIPSKEFPQVEIINRAINDVLYYYENIRNYIYIIKYEKNKRINDIFSFIADVRIIWGGDNTINEIRRSSLRPRTTEITFADRYSFVIINSDKYMSIENKVRFAENFYNDTYLTDQNACTSPRCVVWLGNSKDIAKKVFWDELHKIVEKKYDFKPIMSVNKLTSSYIISATHSGVKIEKSSDNLIVRVKIDKVDASIMEFKDNCGFFFEYDCDNIMDLRDLCNDTHCQTIGFLGEKKDMIQVIGSGIKGVDRIVPIGKTMDFDLIWDGYNLYERLTRVIKFVE